MDDYCGFCTGQKTKPWTRFCKPQCQRDQNQLDFLLRKKLRLQEANAGKGQKKKA